MKTFILRFCTVIPFLLSISITYAQNNLKITTATPNTSGTENVILGAGQKNTGKNNVFTGFQAGISNTTGNFNSFIGHAAGQNNTLGARNTFVGDGSGFSNTQGNLNTFIGGNAGQNNTTGGQNVLIGNFAGFSNNDNFNNVFIGYEAGKENVFGSENIFIGKGAGRKNNGPDCLFIGTDAGAINTAPQNFFLGNEAGFSNVGGSQNTFIGFRAGRSNKDGDLNTFVGLEAGFLNTSGSDNTFIGIKAGTGNSIGKSNVFVGRDAGRANNSGNNNVCLGFEAGFNNGTGNDNVFIGLAAARNNAGGTANVAIGKSAGLTNKTGKENTFVGNLSNAGSDNLTNATAIGNRALVTVSNALVLGSINGKNGATTNVKVGIGLTNPTHQLQLSTDDAAKPGTSTWKVASDKRLKKDIKPFTEGLEVLKQINPVWFKYTGEAGMPTDKKYVGVIAQEMQKIAGYTVDKFTHTNEKGKTTEYLNYDANSLIYILVNAVKELKAEKEEQIAALQQENQEIRKELQEIKQLLAKSKSAAIAAESGEGSKTTEVSQARLYQNQPNPTDGKTIIRYFIPENVQVAQLKVYELSGQEVESISINSRGEGQTEINLNRFPSAAQVLIYHLFIDGNIIDSKKLMLVP